MGMAKKKRFKPENKAWIARDCVEHRLPVSIRAHEKRERLKERTGIPVYRIFA